MPSLAYRFVLIYILIFIMEVYLSGLRRYSKDSMFLGAETVSVAGTTGPSSIL